MAQSKLECIVHGINTFLSGKMYAGTLKEMKGESWQRNAFTRGYNFAHDLYLEDHDTLDNKLELFEVFNKEPLDKNIAKHCICLVIQLQYGHGHEVPLTMPVMTSTQFFCSTVNKNATDVEEVRRKLKEFMDKEEIKCLGFNVL